MNRTSRVTVTNESQDILYMAMNTSYDDTYRLFFMLWIKGPENYSVIRTSGGYDSLVDRVADHVVYFLW